MTPQLFDRFFDATKYKLEIDSLGEHGKVERGCIIDRSNGKVFPFIDYIPRFVEPDHYSQSFGDQWNRYRKVQIDKFNGYSYSKNRFYKGTHWDPDELKGKTVLEVGCGAGRFTQIMLDAGATVVSIDASRAVEACFLNQENHPNHVLIQGDIYHLPFKLEAFDYLFCFGVIQHCPDVRLAFDSMWPFLKKGGQLAVDSYIKATRIDRYQSKYIWRPITKRMPRKWLFRWVEFYVPLWLPIDTLLMHVPFIGRFLTAVIPCWNYWGILILDRKNWFQWAILDTFDALSPTYDQPQTVEKIESWCEEAGFSQFEVIGTGGVLCRATR